MNKFLHHFLAAATLSISPALAQIPTGRVEPPSSPYLATVKAPASWTIRPATPAAVNPDAPAVKEIRVAKAQNLKQELTIWNNGTESESWYVDNFVIYRQPHFVKDDVAIMELQPDSATNFFSISDFATLGWIGQDTFRRIENLKGKPCYYYEMAPPAEQTADAIAAPAHLRSAASKAWVDVKSKLPVAVEEGGILQEYSYTLGAPTILTVPSLFSVRLEKLHARRKATGKLTTP
jgi:hypothetical protein